MQNIELIPLLGSSFTTFAPIITVIVGAFTLFNGYGRILKTFGIESEDAVYVSLCPWSKKPDAAEDESVAEGKKLVARHAGQTSSTFSSAHGKGAMEMYPSISINRKHSGLSQTPLVDEEDEKSSTSSRTYATKSPLYALHGDIESSRSSATSAGTVSDSSSSSSVLKKVKDLSEGGYITSRKYSRVVEADTDPHDEKQSATAAAAAGGRAGIAHVDMKKTPNAVDTTLFETVAPTGRKYGGRYSNS